MVILFFFFLEGLLEAFERGWVMLLVAAGRHFKS